MTKAIKKYRFNRRVFSYPYILFMLIFIVVPLVLILVNAFIANGKLSFQNFADFFSDISSLNILGNSLMVGIITTFFCLLLGYPVAYILSKYNKGKILVLLFVLPMWVNFLLRTLATKSIFVAMNIQLGLGTVIFGMIYNYLPFVILPLYTTLSGIDKSYVEAAQDLGASPMQAFVSATLPLSIPGIVSAITMVFIPTISTFAISQMLSDGVIYLFGDSIQTKFSQDLYGVGSVMSLVMLIMVLVSNFFLSKANKDNKGRNIW